jgi:FAD-dependent urate hydroxylase
MEQQTDLLIVGAGPFGLSLAAYVAHQKIEHMVLGKSMDFWKSNMPRGMLLRSACDWHLDPLNVHTIEAYLKTRQQTPADVEPISLELYLAYAEWFRRQKRIEPVPEMVARLDYSAGGSAYPFAAHLDGGNTVHARRVALAVGFRYFKNIPTELAEILPAGSFSHTCDLVDFAPLKGKRCLVIGGRQSAFEWTALLLEAGASAIHVTHRHATPQFMEADWSWATSVVAAMPDNPGWYRSLSPEGQQDAQHRLWAEGRLKLEPWLLPRIERDNVTIWPRTRLVSCLEGPAGDYAVTLDSGDTFRVDHIILASGYKVDIERVPFLAVGNILPALHSRNGFPILDIGFQTNIPGLYITSMAATQDFGPFFAFTVSVNASARIIGAALAGPAS